MRLLVMLLAASLGLQAAVIDFSSESTGGKPNGYTVAGHPGVTFADTIGAALEVQDFGSQSLGNALAVNGDDASRLLIDFSTSISSLELWFGNDDAGWSSPGDMAWLRIYDGATILSTLGVTMNRDDLMNQSLSWSGASATSALFWYGNVDGTPINLIEIVDNISYSTNSIEGVPEPATWLLMGSALAALALRRKR